jgi:membrane protease YdiL (CAAX protease family)
LKVSAKACNPGGSTPNCTYPGPSISTCADHRVSFELTPHSTPASVSTPASAEAARCTYCHAPLSAFYYFCLACGTPYKSLETVITPARPRELTGEELVRMKSPQVATVFWTYFAVVVGVGVFSLLVFREERLGLQLFLNEIAILATTCVFGWIYRRSLVAQFRKVGFDHYQAWIAISLLTPLLALNFGYHSWLSNLSSDKVINPLTELREAGINEGTLILTFCIFPAVLEEIAYRGLVQHWLQAAIAPWRAIVVASFLFALTHLSPLSLPYLFLVGLLLGWTKQRTGSLYPSMLIHFLHNLIVIELFP